MIMRGLETEGLRVVKGVRDRYDGKRRNPWNEMECGGNYARSMAAWALINAYQGLVADMPEKHVTFNPIHSDQTSVWAFGGGWGKLVTTANSLSLECLGGSVELKRLTLPFLGGVKEVRTSANVKFSVNGHTVELESPVALTAGERILISN